MIQGGYLNARQLTEGLVHITTTVYAVCTKINRDHNIKI